MFLLALAGDLLYKYWLLIATVVGTFAYHTCLKNWTYFSRNGIPFVRGLPILGSMWPMLFNRAGFADLFLRYYRQFPNDRFFGMFEMFGQPTYVIRDPELAKQITIKDFDHFVNHRSDVALDLDPLLGRTIFSTRDDHWRTMRSLISPAFTGSKMRLMLSVVGECAQRFVGELERNMAGRSQVIDMLDVAEKFSSDTIASAAFGLDVNSIRDPDNEFLRMGIEVSDVSGLQGLKLLGYSGFPRIMKFFGIRFFDDKQTKYFRDLVHDTIAYRENNKVVRHDMINLLMEAKKGLLSHSEAGEEVDEDIGFATVQESKVGKADTSNHVWHDDDLVAQSMQFLMAGFSAVALTAGFLALELANNPDVQQRLYAEIHEACGKLNGKPISYEAMQQLRYLDMVVSEVLRRWSIGVVQNRCVNKAYVLENSDGTKVTLKPGDGLWIPNYAIHMDPQYFSDPERFDPERFSDENMDRVVSGTYLPFGNGPRNCIASRFALMETKAFFVYLLQGFELVASPKTKYPMTPKRGTNLLVQSDGGYWAELRPRKK